MFGVQYVVEAFLTSEMPHVSYKTMSVQEVLSRSVRIISRLGPASQKASRSAVTQHKNEIRIVAVRVFLHTSITRLGQADLTRCVSRIEQASGL